MIAGLGFGELVLIFAVVLLLFGAKRLPEIASAMGTSIRSFRSGMNEVAGELEGPPRSEPLPPALPARADGGGGGS